MPCSLHKASNKSLSYYICRKETFYNGSRKQRISKTSCLEADIWFRNSFQIMSVLQAQGLSYSEGRLRFEVLLEGHSPALPRYLDKQPGHMEIMTSTRQRKSSSISPVLFFWRRDVTVSFEESVARARTVQGLVLNHDSIVSNFINSGELLQEELNKARGRETSK